MLQASAGEGFDPLVQMMGEGWKGGKRKIDGRRMHFVEIYQHVQCTYAHVLMHAALTPHTYTLLSLQHKSTVPSTAASVCTVQSIDAISFVVRAKLVSY